MPIGIVKRNHSWPAGAAWALMLISSATMPVVADEISKSATAKSLAKRPSQDVAEFRRLFYKCKELAKKKEFRALVQTTSEGLQKFPHTYDFHAYRATAYLFLHMKEPAMADYSACLRIAPTPQVYMVRGDIYKSLGDIRTALEDYKRAQKLKPRADNLVLMGEAYLEIQDMDTCAATCKKALAMLNTVEKDMRTYTEARANEIIGTVYLAKKDPKQALVSLDRAVKITQSWGPPDPKSIDPNYLNNNAFKSKCILNRGEAYEKLGNLKKAIADYEAAVKFHPKNFDYRKSLLRALKKANEDQRALALINQLLSEDDAPDLYYKRAEILKKMGQIEKANIDISRARKIEYGIMGEPVDR